MKNHVLSFFGIALVLFSIVPSNAETQTNIVSNDISLNQAVANTLMHNPALVAYGYEIDIQNNLITQNKLPQSPSLNVEFENGLGTGEFTGLDRLESTISIGWLLNREERNQRVNIAEANYNDAVGESGIARIDAAAETARRYLICLADQTRLITAKDALSLAKQTIEAVKRRVNASKAPKAELARAQATLAIKELEYGDSQHELENSYARLSSLWGNVKPTFNNVVGDLSKLPNIDSFGVLQNRIKQNPEFARILSQERVAQAELNLAKTLSKPQWKVTAGVRRFEEENDQALLLNFSLPLQFSNRNQGNIAAKYAQIEKLNSQSKVAEVRLSTELFVLYQELQHSIHRVATLENTVIPSLVNASHDSKQAYERGRYSYFEWQTVQSELIQSKKELLEAIIDVHLYVIEIERITGVDITRSMKL
jgi:cobalt-zinc-cadmium efflux system outer membrane protein